MEPSRTFGTKRRLLARLLEAHKIAGRSHPLDREPEAADAANFLANPTSDFGNLSLKLRTLILLRWLLVAGQASAVLVGALGLGLDLRLDLCLAIVTAAVLFNLASLRHLEERRLGEAEMTIPLVFDFCQIGALLYLTGGLSNPLSYLLLVPFTIGASVLTLRSAVLLGSGAMLVTAGLLVSHQPLMLASGEILNIPRSFAFANWAMLTGIGLCLAIIARRFANEMLLVSWTLAATRLALVRDQRIALLGGLAASAAHELGTPLATIKLAAAELADELADRPDQEEDARLIGSQANRCQEILRTLGSAATENAGHRVVPLSQIVEEAARPHMDRGIRIITRVAGSPPDEASCPQPLMLRLPETIQGLRSLVQNGVDFARSHVWLDLDWTATQVRVVIGDDGPGFPADFEIGDPFSGGHACGSPERPGYNGLGLGLFIAKTLLERTGAAIAIPNSVRQLDTLRLAGPAELSPPPGAVITVTWPRSRIENLNHRPSLAW